MRREKIDKHLAEAAVYGILATWPTFSESGALAGQWATVFDDYPTKEAERAAYTAATGDLGGLYSHLSPLMSSYLYAQRQRTTPDQVPPLDELEKHARAQIGFLIDHIYPIPEANKLFTVLSLRL